MSRRSPSGLLLSVEAAARELGISRATLYKAIKEGSCPVEVIRVGRQLKVPRASLERLRGAKETDEGAQPGRCPTCGRPPSRILPTYVAAFWSSSVTGSV